VRHTLDSLHSLKKKGLCANVSMYLRQRSQLSEPGERRVFDIFVHHTSLYSITPPHVSMALRMCGTVDNNFGGKYSEKRDS